MTHKTLIELLDKCRINTLFYLFNKKTHEITKGFVKKIEIGEDDIFIHVEEFDTARYEEYIYSSEDLTKDLESRIYWDRRPILCSSKEELTECISLLKKSRDAVIEELEKKISEI